MIINLINNKPKYKKMKILIFTTDKNRFIHLLNQLKNNINFNIENIILLSTSYLDGKEFSFGDETIKVQNINHYKEFDDETVAIFMVNKELTEQYIYDFIENDSIVLDNSGYYLEDNNIPTIMYDLNINKIEEYKNKNVIKLPSASTIQLLRTIEPLNKINKIKRIVISTYQATSNINNSAMDELFLHTKKIYENSFLPPENFKKQIAFNVLPQVGDIDNNNYYKEEQRIMLETNNILNNKINITATCAFVPVFTCNCQSINIEFENSFNLDDIYNIYEDSIDYINIIDRFDEFKYATPKEVATEENVFISRIRRDSSIKNGLNLWSVADNINLESENIVEILKALQEKI